MNNKKYVLNCETRKIELHFEKSDYKVLTEEEKKELKSFYLWSSKASAWVSRSVKNHYSAIRTAEKLGFSDGGKVGERLTYAEEIERKAKKAEVRAERFEQHAVNAKHRAENLQAGFNEAAKDWSWVTQPIIKGHKGSERFERQKQKLIHRYEKGFSEYRKSNYFKEKAITALQTANMNQLKNKSYLNNRIEECNKNIRALQRKMVIAEERGNEEWKTELLFKMEYELDKLAYMENCMDELGGVQYNKKNIKTGYLVQIRKEWGLVAKANLKTIEVKFSHVPYTLKYTYADIRDVKVPEGWTEQKGQVINPFHSGDVLVISYSGTDKIRKAYQVIKTTEKSAIIQRIKIENGAPISDEFISNKQERRAVRTTRSGEIAVNHDDGYLLLYKRETIVG
ncbi:DUF3560 domain-containing protein [Brevibacillus laterosporus]|uniref:DUF3560 domain-containing protein n=1 Tax=Brevibacillus laterosporus TaxID=1465 RepID=UPI0035A5CC94